MGQLTQIGALQHKKLGEVLRKNYINEFKFLPSDFDPKFFFIRSVDKPRNIKSFESLFYGLYPSIGTSAFTGINFQIIELESDVNFNLNFFCYFTQ